MVLQFRRPHKHGAFTPTRSLNPLSPFTLLAAVNVLLIGIYKTVATTCFQIFDCTEFNNFNGDPLVSKLIMDHSGKKKKKKCTSSLTRL